MWYVYLTACLQNKCNAATLIDIVEGRVNDVVTGQGLYHLAENNEYNFVGMYTLVHKYSILYASDELCTDVTRHGLDKL